jgi:drug/metabolite transporter (DMT)-like permease
MPPVSTDRAARGRNAWIGVPLLIGAALMYSTHTNLARLSYDYGVSTLTILAGRSLSTLLLVGLWLWWRRQPALLPRRALPMLIVVGGTFSLQSLFYLGAIHFIPVSLAVLLFYLYPILVLLIGTALGLDRMTPVRTVGALAAFGGLALALNVQGGGLDWIGVALGAAAALAVAINVVGAGYMQGAAPIMTVTFHMLLIASVGYSAALAVAGGPTWPSGGADGWALFAGVMATAPLAQMGFYGALAFLSGSRVGIIMNCEPIMTTAFALIILGETLAPVQIAGAALVIGAIFGVALLDRPARAA